MISTAYVESITQVSRRCPAWQRATHYARWYDRWLWERAATEFVRPKGADGTTARTLAWGATYRITPII